MAEYLTKSHGVYGDSTVKKPRSTKKRTKKGGIGQSFDDYLKEDGTYAVTMRGAVKIVLASGLEKVMKEEKITKVELAKRLSTSRSQVDRLLDPDNENVTLSSLTNAARAVGRELILDLGPPERSD